MFASSNFASYENTAPAMHPARTPSPGGKKSVSFHGQVCVARTFASEDYNRASIPISPLLQHHISEFHEYHRAMSVNISIQQQLFKWQRETDRFLAEALTWKPEGLICNNGGNSASVPSLASSSSSMSGDSDDDTASVTSS